MSAEDASARDASGQQLPVPSFDVLLQVLASPCYVHLGMVANPTTDKTEANLPQARWAIDLLSVLEQKTKGNLDDRESSVMTQVLSQLRSAYAAAAPAP